MSKKNKNKSGFTNLLANKFNDQRRIELYSESEVYDLFDKDFETLLKQLSDNLLEVAGAKYPVYTQMLFHNPSVARYIYDYIKSYKDELSKEELLALRHLVATGYKDTMSKQYLSLDDDIRKEYLLKSFRKITGKRIRIARRLKLSAEDKDMKLDSATALAIYSFLSIDQIGRVATMFDKSEVKNSVKMKIFKKLYGDRFKSAYGALFTIDRDNDFVSFMFDKFMKSSKKDRKKVLFFYATHFKKQKHKSHLLESDAFFKKNKKITKKLGKSDVGFKKAFKPYKEIKKFGENRNDNNKGNQFKR